MTFPVPLFPLLLTLQRSRHQYATPASVDTSHLLLMTIHHPLLLHLLLKLPRPLLLHHLLLVKEWLLVGVVSCLLHTKITLLLRPRLLQNLNQQLQQQKKRKTTTTATTKATLAYSEVPVPPEEQVEELPFEQAHCHLHHRHPHFKAMKSQKCKFAGKHKSCVSQL